MWGGGRRRTGDSRGQTSAVLSWAPSLLIGAVSCEGRRLLCPLLDPQPLNQYVPRCTQYFLKLHELYFIKQSAQQGKKLDHRAGIISVTRATCTASVPLISVRKINENIVTFTEVIESKSWNSKCQYLPGMVLISRARALPTIANFLRSPEKLCLIAPWVEFLGVHLTPGSRSGDGYGRHMHDTANTPQAPQWTWPLLNT